MPRAHAHCCSPTPIRLPSTSTAEARTPAAASAVHALQQKLVPGSCYTARHWQVSRVWSCLLPTRHLLRRPPSGTGAAPANATAEPCRAVLRPSGQPGTPSASSWPAPGTSTAICARLLPWRLAEPQESKQRLGASISKRLSSARPNQGLACKLVLALWTVASNQPQTSWSHYWQSQWRSCSPHARSKKNRALKSTPTLHKDPFMPQVDTSKRVPS